MGTCPANESFVTDKKRLRTIMYLPTSAIFYEFFYNLSFNYLLMNQLFDLLQSMRNKTKLHMLTLGLDVTTFRVINP